MLKTIGNIRRQTVLILLFAVFVYICKGQNSLEPIEKSIPETRASAPTRIVRSFIQDRKGNIWIATHEGVFRYDDKLFINITREVAPPRVGDGPENRFYAVQQDSEGEFWFRSTRLALYQRNEWHNMTEMGGTMATELSTPDPKG